MALIINGREWYLTPVPDPQELRKLFRDLAPPEPTQLAPEPERRSVRAPEPERTLRVGTVNIDLDVHVRGNSPRINGEFLKFLTSGRSINSGIIDAEEPAKPPPPAPMVMP